MPERVSTGDDGRCQDCREPGRRLAVHQGRMICDTCEIEREREAADAHEIEYEDARWDLAHDYGYDEP